MEHEQLTEKIIGASYVVHNELGWGFLEKVYENALKIELQNQGFDVQQQTPIVVKYKDHVVGEYYADMIVENEIIVEVKAVTQLLKEHEVQLFNYLQATKKEVGMLINFGKSVEIKRKNLNPVKKSEDSL